ncbi:hypothetical protein GGR21_003586 [Dysgonomonas hofstadii]|uniref:Replication initiation factor n=1 Tax=Dysgonomonas hofstadii TaxID=637886 RepID=A0A840CY33_9BACT|nr:hypothetical protein [Dysgonomonas hofstadii]MBB4037665.1 hypothetical protein [Dysgonomonas hofstadii]
MIDGVSLLIRHSDDIQRIERNKNLHFVARRGYRSAIYKGLEIKLRANSCWINGSLHKFKNEGEHNADDFTYSDLKKTLANLCNEIGITRDFAEIKNIEIGVNIILPYDPIYFIDSIIKRKTYYPEFTSVGSRFNYSQYAIKIYSKSKQDKRYKDDNILRLEIRFEKMIEARKRVGKIEFLSDLLEPSFWFYSGRCLNSLLNDIDIIDINKLISEKIPAMDMVEVLAWRYRDRWERCSTSRQRMKEKVYKILEAHSLTDIKKNVQKMIGCKVNELLVHPKIQEYIQRVEATREKMLHISI